MAIIQSNLHPCSFPSSLPEPANNDDPAKPQATSDQRILSWLFRFSPRKKHNPPTNKELLSQAMEPFERSRRFLTERARKPVDDWQTVAQIMGVNVEDLVHAGVELPLSAAEIDHFRRNHREMDRSIGRDFLVARSELPSPVAELYGLYRHRARLDTEATLFVAQATGSVRTARIMADMLAIGAFAGGHEYLAHLTATYSVTAAFDTSDLIDRTADEALRRLALPIGNPSHLLKLSPDELSVLANNIVERNALAPGAFLEKANLLSEARQDVHRLPASKHLVTAIEEGDLPSTKTWVLRLCAAYARLIGAWVENIPSARDYLPSNLDADTLTP